MANRPVRDEWLLPTLEGHIPADLSRDLGSMHANLQLAYASAASAKTVE